MKAIFDAVGRKTRDLFPNIFDPPLRPVSARSYDIPHWLIAPPASDRVPWQWQVPSLEEPVSQLCTSDQMTGPYYEDICARIHEVPRPHRKVWEFVFIMAVLSRYGKVQPGMRLLGFGVGCETLPAVFASLGAKVVATDAPTSTIANHGWQTTNQHASDLEALYRPHVLSHEQFQELVTFEAVDMNAIPSHLTNFDGCWSACAFEHLGSIDKGLDFVANSIKALKPGGIAVHTTEFNLSSNDKTFDRNHLALFRRQDFERLAVRLVDEGHKVWPLNLYPGSTEVDAHIDLPPYDMPHLKLEVAGYVTTSFGIIVQRGA